VTKTFAPAIGEANPKSESRNPKQTERNKQNEIRKSKTPNAAELGLEFRTF
jgi:hypothetical protein